MPKRVLYQLEKVEVLLGGRPVLHNVHGVVTQGAFLGVIGPNGAGKTTLIRTLAGTLRPKRGKVKLKGKPLKSVSRRELAKSLAVVPYALEVPVAFTVEECVAMGRMPYLPGWATLSKHDRSLMKESMETTDVLSMADRPLHSLSGGERHRAMVAMALAQEPEILVLDEPTAHLDLHHAWGLLELVKKLHKDRGLTIIMSCHDLNLAGTFCNELLLLNEGKVERWGPTADVMMSTVLSQVYQYPLDVVRIGPAGRWVVPNWVLR